MCALVSFFIHTETQRSDHKNVQTQRFQVNVSRGTLRRNASSFCYQTPSACLSDLVWKHFTKPSVGLSRSLIRLHRIRCGINTFPEANVNKRQPPNGKINSRGTVKLDGPIDAHCCILLLFSYYDGTNTQNHPERDERNIKAAGLDKTNKIWWICEAKLLSARRFDSTDPTDTANEMMRQPRT